MGVKFFTLQQKLTFQKYHLLNIVLYFSVKGYIFTKKGTDAGTKVYSHSTTLIRKILRTSQPKFPHFTTTKPTTLTPPFQPKTSTFYHLTIKSRTSNKKISPHKMQGDISPNYQLISSKIEHYKTIFEKS